MKRTLLLAAWLSVSAAQALSIQIPVNQDIPDGDLAGLTSQTSFGGLAGVVQNLTVSLNIEGTYNGDLYAYLTHGSGFSVLLNRSGRTAGDSLGYADSGFNVVFSDAAAVDIHQYGGNAGLLVSGTYQPDGRSNSPLDVLDTTTPRDAFLSSFNGVDPNGEWTLFVADVSGGDLHQLKSWGLDFEVVPSVVPEGSPQLGMFAASLAVLAWMRIRSRRDA